MIKDQKFSPRDGLLGDGMTNANDYVIDQDFDVKYEQEKIRKSHELV